MHIRVKICGITTYEAATAAVREGADALGFVFADSPRRLTTHQALEITRRLPTFVTRVAVMRNPTPHELTEVISSFNPDIVQTEPNASALTIARQTGRSLLPVLHDDGTLNDQLAVLQATHTPVRTVILEGPGRGGRGVAPDWSHAAKLARQVSLVLAGGLRPDNVESAIARVRPFAVDVSSGVETAPGIKDPHLIADFMAAVRKAERGQARVPLEAS